MSRKQVVGRVLLVLLVVVILAGAGYALYRIGYVNGVAAANDGHVVFGRFFGNFNLPGDMMKDHPWMQFDRPESGSSVFGDHLQSMPGAFNRSPLTRSFYSRYSLYSPFSILFRLICLGFLIWVGYKVISAIFGGKGWKLSFQKMPAEDGSPEEKTAAKKKN
jgi:hypothetical protein